MAPDQIDVLHIRQDPRYSKVESEQVLIILDNSLYELASGSPTFHIPLGPEPSTETLELFYKQSERLKVLKVIRDNLVGYAALQTLPMDIF